jgi:hypothetical protein
MQMPLYGVTVDPEGVRSVERYQIGSKVFEYKLQYSTPGEGEWAIFEYVDERGDGWFRRVSSGNPYAVPDHVPDWARRQ